MTCLSNVWYNLISVIGYTPAISKPLVYENAGVLIADIALTAILPATFEEFTNRGLCYGANENARFPTFAIILSALMFALMHTNVTQVFYTFFSGLSRARSCTSRKVYIPRCFAISSTTSLR